MTKLPPKDKDTNLSEQVDAQELSSVHVPGPEHSLSNPPEAAVVIMRDKTKDTAMEALQFEAILPRTFSVGETLETNIVEVDGRKSFVSVGSFSNKAFREIKPGEKAKIGVAAVKSNDRLIKSVLVDLDASASEEKLNIPRILADQLDDVAAPEPYQSLKSPIFPLSVTVDLDNHSVMNLVIDTSDRLLFTNGIGKNIRCYVIRGRNIQEVPRDNSSEVQLNPGDVVFAATAGMIDVLINNMTRKSYQTEKLGEKSPAEKSLEELPDEFIDQEAANQVLGAISEAYKYPLKKTEPGKSAQGNSSSLMSDKFLTVAEDRNEDNTKPKIFSNTALMQGITAAYRKAMRKVSPRNLTHTAAFVVYRVPDSEKKK